MKSVQAHDTKTRWNAVDDIAQLYESACKRILEIASDAIKQRGHFLIVLAGGNTPKGVYQMLRYADTDWSCWQIYFGDERCLAANDTKRNSQMAAHAWLDHVAIPKNQVHVIPAELGALAAARAYTRTLYDVGEFDLVLLGLGEDGHTASLFPGNDWCTEASAANVLAIENAPKPPAQRVSLSAKRLSHARAVLFLITGESKRDAVRRWRAGADIPAAAIQPSTGVDVLAEAKLLHPALP